MGSHMLLQVVDADVADEPCYNCQRTPATHLVDLFVDNEHDQSAYVCERHVNWVVGCMAYDYTH